MSKCSLDFCAKYETAGCSWPNARGCFEGKGEHNERLTSDEQRETVEREL